jgi:hypothetical protein
MGVEKTMQFILEQQAQLTAHQVDAGARLARIDKRLDAMAKLVNAGVRLLVKHDEWLARHEKAIERHEKLIVESRREFDLRLKALTEVQERTDRKLDRLIEALHGRRSNGRSGRKA